MKTVTSTREIKLKSGEILPVGTTGTIHWKEGVWTQFCFTTLEREYVFSNTVLPKFGFEIPDIEELGEAVHDGQCESVFGDTVEPDGWDSEGSPSWLLALGMI